MANDPAPDDSGGAVTTAPREPDAGFPDRKPEPLGLRIQHVLHANPILGPLAVLVLAIIAFSLVSSRFLSVANLGLVLAQVTVIATLALGQTLVILTAGIDLSAGAIAVFSSIIMANLATKAGLPGPVALLLGFACGTAMGLLNGLLVTRMKLPPFIVTLGTLSIFFSLNSVVSKSETVRGSDMPDIMTWTGNTFGVGGFRITYGSIIMLLLFAFFFYALGRTAWGKHVYATGDDIEAARLAGIRTDRVLLSVYTVAGLIYAHRRLGADGPARVGQPERRRRVQPRLHHRRRAGRHEPVRRPRHGARHAGRRADRRRLPQRPAARPASTSSGRASRSACSCSSPSRSTSGSGR